MAFVLKLPIGCSAKELYLAMLEASAKLLRIPKYQIYTVDQLRDLVQEHYEKLEDQMHPSRFTHTLIQIERNRTMNLKGKKFFDTQRFYTGRDHISSESGSRSEREEEKRPAG